ncbi:MAG: hypothetical protein COU85_00045 [Candidatus Portnoybacteria bacterium CG10_big_fil_rev_8_21_14_0_10_44_7]|uniref:Uncharacterized protein n=1 Tax=Candidatus Portnoybacteria bacterium CG10_big_fil_rev_8_21_14_0_10_44_7 TaxID=1974816 RepID=A0A2M8KJM2_9BACT|nr:MAG: hypothetical protein COU85_00045 [Candidatus Portnoybacteria bacterium CG10_big_fil_rev_8_21_14_0_10_44_7]
MSKADKVILLTLLSFLWGVSNVSPGTLPLPAPRISADTVWQATNIRFQSSTGWRLEAGELRLLKSGEILGQRVAGFFPAGTGPAVSFSVPQMVILAPPVAKVNKMPLGLKLYYATAGTGEGGSQ